MSTQIGNILGSMAKKKGFKSFRDWADKYKAGGVPHLFSDDTRAKATLAPTPKSTQRRPAASSTRRVSRRQQGTVRPGSSGTSTVSRQTLLGSRG